jgi:hypothetical protein
MDRQRRAYVCDKCYAAKTPLRIFLTAADEKPPRCPVHGKMRLERNKSYRPPTEENP